MERKILSILALRNTYYKSKSCSILRLQKTNVSKIVKIVNIDKLVKLVTLVKLRLCKTNVSKIVKIAKIV